MNLELEFEGAVEGAIGGNAVIARIFDSTKRYQYLFDFGVEDFKFQAVSHLGLEPESLDDYVHRKLIRNFDFSINACFISHAHADHYLALKALYRSKYSPFPVWASRTTSAFIGGGINFANVPLHSDPIRIGSFYEERNLGSAYKFRIIPYPVDHDIPGACAYFIQTDKSLIIYSGDFRDHGLLSNIMSTQFWEYVDKLAKDKSRILITEGTNFGLPFAYNSDADFQSRVKSILQTYVKGLIVLAVKDTATWDIIAALIAVEHSSFKRVIVLSSVISRTWGKISRCFQDDYRNVISSDSMRLIDWYLISGKHKVLDFSKSDIALNLLREIALSPSMYLVIATRREALKIMDFVSGFGNRGGGCCIYNVSGSGDGSNESTRDFARAMADLGFSLEDTNSKARGHVSPHKIVEVVKKIHANKVLLMHTLNPEGLRDFLQNQVDSEVLTPALGHPIGIE